MKICIWGDSITWGANDYEKGGWAERLKLYFLKKSEKNINIYNLGISGDTTDDLVKRFKFEAEDRKPKIIIFAIGINDAAFSKIKNENRVNVENFRENLDKLLVEAKNITGQVIFIGLTLIDEIKTTPVSWSSDVNYLIKDIIRYDNELKIFCEQNGLKYIDMSGLLDTLDLEDGLHPNSNGHEKIFQKVLKELEI